MDRSSPEIPNTRKVQQQTARMQGDCYDGAKDILQRLQTCKYFVFVLGLISSFLDSGAALRTVQAQFN